MAVKRKARRQRDDSTKRHKPSKLGMKCNICGAVHPGRKSTKRKRTEENTERMKKGRRG